MKTIKIILAFSLVYILTACGEYKQILPGNKVYKYINNQSTTDKGKDKIIEYEVKHKFSAKLSDKTTRYEIAKIKDDHPNLTPIDTADIDGADVASYAGMENIYYTHENRKLFEVNSDPLRVKYFEQENFWFYHGKFALNALTIPLKFRKGVGDEALNPSTLETGFNVNFAPSYRLNWSSFNPSRKFLGNNLTNYSLTFGGLLGIGGTDLKTKTNAPGLLSDRKSTTLTYGGTIIFGFNSFGVGYAVGFDNVLGTGSKYWVYQNKVWHGIIVSVDLIK